MEAISTLLADFDHWLELGLTALATATVALRRVRRALVAFGRALREREGDDSG